MKMIPCFAVAALLSAQLQASEIPLDRKESSLKFIGHALLHDFHGEAKEISGSAQVDSTRPEIVSTAKLSIQTSKMTTFNSGRDRNMFAWLKVAQDPEIHFDLTRVISMDGKAQGATREHPSQFIVLGNLTLNNVPKPLQVQVSGWREGKLLVVAGATQINTSDHDLPVLKKLWMSVDKEVNIEFRLAFDLPPNLQIR